MPDVRLCVCGKAISSLRSKRAKYCSNACGDEYRNSERFLVHSCLASTSDSYQTGCDCKKLVSEKVAKDLLKRSECVTLALRDFVFDQGPLLYVQGASGKTPRVGTIERPHIERGTQNFSPSIGKGTRTRTIDEVQALLLAEKMDEDDIPWDEIERMRWDEYHRLDIEAMY